MPRRHTEIADIINAEGRALESPDHHVKRMAVFIGVIIVLALIFIIATV